MQIALVAVVLLAGMWFTVLKPKPDSGSSEPAAAVAATPVAPGTKGLTSAIDKAKAASATSDAANAKVQAATGSSTPAATPSAATVAARKAGTKAAAAKAVAAKQAAAKTAATKAAAKKAAASGTVVDPSDRLLAYLRKGKTLVILFYGKGSDDKSARKAVHRTALKAPKSVVTAYVPIAKVGQYEAITGIVDILVAPTVVVIGTDHKATSLTGFIQAQSVMQAVGDARRDDTAAAKAKSTK